MRSFRGLHISSLHVFLCLSPFARYISDDWYTFMARIELAFLVLFFGGNWMRLLWFLNDCGISFSWLYATLVMADDNSTLVYSSCDHMAEGV